MEIEIIRTSAVGNPLEPTKKFGLYLKKFTSSLHLLHWYAGDYSAHEILGDVYKDLDKTFDKLQEEIIGTCKGDGVVFPSFNIILDVGNLEQYNCDVQKTIQFYTELSNQVKSILTSIEFNLYISSVQSGIANTRDDILSILNKGSYLLSMIVVF
jgi:DNA-binding ferritin-like protein